MQPGGSSDAVSYDANGNLLSVAPINQNLGTTGQYLGQTFAETHAAGATDLYSFIVSDSEVASVLSGSVIIGIEVSSSAGFNPALPTIDGLSPIYSSVQAGQSIGLYRLPAGGAYIVSVTGADGTTSGAYHLQVYLPGDVNGDSRVDGTDEQLFAAALGSSIGQPGYVLGADAERTGTVTAQDYLILESNFGFTADQPPVATNTTISTREGVPVTIDLSTLAGDPQGDLIGYTLSDPQNGTISLALDGHTATFIPAPGYSGPAQFSFTADDPSASSNVATVTINVETATLSDIEFGQQDLQLNIGQTSVLTVTGLYVDGTTGSIPAGQVVFSSTNPAVATVGPNGAIVTLSAGQTILTATIDGLTAATPLTVGTNPAPETLSFFPLTYALTVGQSRQFQVLELMSDGSQSDVSSAADGTVYYVSNPALGTISPDGLFTATALGSELVTVIQDGQSEVATLTITTPVTGGTATVTASGTIVSDADDTILGVGPGALPAGTQITVGSLPQANLPSIMPSGFNYAQGFTLDTGGVTASDPLSVAIPAPAGSQPGDTLYLFRWGELLEGNFQTQAMWELVDEMVVGSDGMARTASPPYSGVLITGDYTIGAPDTQPGLVDGDMGSGGPGEVILPSSVNSSSQVVPLAEAGSIRGTQYAGPASNPATYPGGTWYMEPNPIGLFVAPIVVKFQTLLLQRANQWGSVSQATPITVNPGVIQPVNVTVQAPSAPTLNQPIITAFSLNASLQVPLLSISGTGFDVSNPQNDQVYVLPAASDTNTVPGLASLNLVPGTTGQYSPLPGPVTISASGALQVPIPAGIAIGGSSICVVVKTMVVPPPAAGQNPVPQPNYNVSAETNFSVSQAPGYIYVVDSGTNTLQVLLPSATAGASPVTVANIKVGQNPSQVVLSPDGLTAFVTNTGSGTISIIDTETLAVVNLNPPGATPITALPLPGNASPNYITVASETDSSGDTTGYRVFVDDRHNGNIYEFDSSVISQWIAGNETMPTTVLNLGSSIKGAEGMAVAYSSGVAASAGEYLYVASAGTADQGGDDAIGTPGFVAICKVGNFFGQAAGSNPYQQIGTIPTGPKPFGVTSYQTAGGSWYVGVTVRGSQNAGYMVINCNTQSPQTFPVNLRGTPVTVPLDYYTLAPGVVGSFLFDNYNAQAVVYDTITINNVAQTVAFVLFHNTYEEGDPRHDPTYGAGGDVGILVNPFGLPGTPTYWLGATEEIPSRNGSFPTGLTLSPDGGYLYVTVTGLDQIYAYSVGKIVATLNLLQAVYPAAIGGPGANQPSPLQPLDTYAAELVAAGSPAQFDAMYNPGFSSTMSQQAWNAAITSLSSTPNASLVNTSQSLSSIGLKNSTLPGSNPTVTDYLLSYVTTSGPGSNPEGIAAGPPLQPNLTAVVASIVSATQLSFTYTVSGKFTAPVVVLVTAAEAGTTLNPTNIISEEFSVPNLTPGALWTMPLETRRPDPPQSADRHQCHDQSPIVRRFAQPDRVDLRRQHFHRLYGGCRADRPVRHESDPGRDRRDGSIRPVHPGRRFARHIYRRHQLRHGEPGPADRNHAKHARFQHCDANRRHPSQPGRGEHLPRSRRGGRHPHVQCRRDRQRHHVDCGL